MNRIATTVRLEDDTTGTCIIDEGTDPIGTVQTIMLNSENGPLIERTGIVAEVLD